MAQPFRTAGPDPRIGPEDLLEILHDHAFLAPFSLAVLCKGEGEVAFHGTRNRVCSLTNRSPLCQEDCLRARESEALAALRGDRAGVYSCPAGIFHFYLPLPALTGRHCYLHATGVRESSLDLQHLERVSRQKKLSGIQLLEEWEKLPHLSRDQVELAAEKAGEALAALYGESFFARSFERTVMLINVVADVAPELDRVQTLEEAVGLFAETVTVLFDVPRVAALLPEEDGSGLLLKGVLGLKLAPARLSGEAVARTLLRRGGRRLELQQVEIPELFPSVAAERALCFPLAVEGEFLGCLALFDVRLSSRDLLLVELLADKVSAKLQRLQTRERHRREAAQAEQMVEMIGALAQSRTRRELSQNILDRSAELLRATKGSLMLLDESREFLHIAASRGMNPQLAASMRTKVGEGIAGSVTRNGRPLLVYDIEKDERLGTSNRPRFTTKSFLSVPLGTKGTVLGALNLSDKQTAGPFTDRDLQMVSAFLSHAAAMIERTDSLERASHYEKLSITDPLTGLYNRRFLEQRMEEELSRSARQKLELSVLVIDLDHFKAYNDLCGHLAGDRVLQRCAQLLRASARDMDIVTRFGGEEFCALLPATSKREAQMVAERMRRSMEKEAFPREDGMPGGRLTASFGLATYPSDAGSSRTLIEMADVALYRAKAQGRNQVVLFEPAFQQEEAGA